jgi:hypothetical protein
LRHKTIADLQQLKRLEAKQKSMRVQKTRLCSNARRPGKPGLPAHEAIAAEAITSTHLSRS